MSLVSCMDMGEGDTEDAFLDYFSSVILLDREGRSSTSIARLADFESEDAESEIRQVIDASEYCYIAFEVARGYTLTVSEFVMYTFTDGAEGTLEIEIYRSGTLPVMEKDENGNFLCYNDDEIVTQGSCYLKSSLRVKNEWTSRLLDFDTRLTAESGDYILVKIKNNCTADGSDGLSAVSFTFNYTLFYFDEVKTS